MPKSISSRALFGNVGALLTLISFFLFTFYNGGSFMSLTAWQSLQKLNSPEITLQAFPGVLALLSYLLIPLFVLLGHTRLLDFLGKSVDRVLHVAAIWGLISLGVFTLTLEPVPAAPGLGYYGLISGFIVIFFSKLNIMNIARSVQEKQLAKHPAVSKAD